ncbi:RsmB/NOP family class I SAM-dependent RNA methyltransferase [Corynebacterium uterequi]|uniref:tRNA/rRNA cytosine-C5-methylase n=1 Tax=Corynebacterium uterequi TaxID=1072256 RepID=A0A0G3HEN4_9CORY|nr:transcription antitermination factor NusB [Corynebacterium uterequi]AKK11175.1 tRNA/rRNA cytosine-C5-methylase [Corynebacterium uterequi]
MTGGFRSRSTGGDRPAPKKPNANSGGQKRSPRRTGASKPRSERGQQPRRQRTTPGFADPARQAAFDTLRRVTEDGAYANLTLPGLMRQRKLSERDAGFATELTYGTLRTLGVLDNVIAACSSRPIDDIDPGVLDVLRLGTYQLLNMRVEPHAAVDTSVRLAEHAGFDWAKGFVNAVLRSVGRTPAEQWREKLAPTDPLARVAWESAHPVWVARSFATALGVEADDPELARALAADSQRPVVHLVARPGEISAEELALITGGEQGAYSPYAVYLESGDPGKLEPVRQRLAGVQDEGSQLIARALVEAEVAQDQGRWLDLCAGPGGKAALVGSLARAENAHVDAVEVSEHRAGLIEKAVGDAPVTVHVADGRNPGLEPGFDRVLVDAPCSGLGALRRRPEARWRKSERDIAELTALQFELLASALSLVRPGGVVIYSTCSPDVRETRQVVDRAVAECGAIEEDAHALIPDLPGSGDGLSVQMWPHRHGTDAMFFAVLRRS